MEWLPASSRAPCKNGLLEVIQLVLNAGMLHPDPKTRPQTVEAARGFLEEALKIYKLHETEEKSREEMRLREEGGGGEYDSG